jgi:uncharacterized protein with HEPN domain
MRDRLVHDYMGINYRIVWDVATNINPDIRTQIASVSTTDNRTLFDE